MLAGFPTYEIYNAATNPEEGRSAGEAVSRAVGGNLLGALSFPLGLVGGVGGYMGGAELGGMLYKGLTHEKSSPERRAQQYFQPQPQREQLQQGEYSQPTLQRPKISQTLNIANTATAPIAVGTPPAPDPVNPVTPAVSVPGMRTPSPMAATQLPSGGFSQSPQTAMAGIKPGASASGGGAGPAKGSANESSTGTGS